MVWNPAASDIRILKARAGQLHINRKWPFWVLEDTQWPGVQAWAFRSDPATWALYPRPQHRLYVLSMAMTSAQLSGFSSDTVATHHTSAGGAGNRTLHPSASSYPNCNMRGELTDCGVGRRTHRSLGLGQTSGWQGPRPRSEETMQMAWDCPATVIFRENAGFPSLQEKSFLGLELTHPRGRAKQGSPASQASPEMPSLACVPLGR